MRYLVMLIHPMSDIRFALEQGEFTDKEIERINEAWRKSLAIQVSLWTYPHVKDGDW